MWPEGEPDEDSFGMNGTRIPAHPQIPTSVILRDLLAILREMPLTDEQLEQLYTTIKERYDKHQGK